MKNITINLNDASAWTIILTSCFLTCLGGCGIYNHEQTNQIKICAQAGLVQKAVPRAGSTLQDIIWTSPK